MLYLLMVTAFTFGVDPFYGVNEDIVWDNPGDVPGLMAKVDKLGAGSLRIAIRWRVVEAQQGVWDFAKVDKV